MSKKFLKNLFLFTLILSVLSGCSADAPTISSEITSGQQSGLSESNTDSQTQDENALYQKLEKAYIYTLPLMIMDATNTKMTNTEIATTVQAPPNQFIHAKHLADAQSKDVVTPNVDTIYSQVYLDLSQDAVVMELPKTDRFCMAEVIDAYTNCIALIDAASFENSSELYIFTGSSFTGEIPSGMKEIKCPTNLSWIIIRTISNSKEDEQVRTIQSQMHISTLSRYLDGEKDGKENGSFKEENNFIPIEYVKSLSIEDYFTRANELMKNNPPAEEDSALLSEIAQIGVGAELCFDSSVFGEEKENYWKSCTDNITQKCIDHSSEFVVKNGIWNYWGSPIAEFGKEYEYRALIAMMGLGANPVSVAIYPKATTDAEGGRLNGTQSYILHFDADSIPKTKENGFWSITAYNSKNNLLIDNDIDRYCINDRSDVVYNDDGSLDIYIQSEKPDSNKEKNWLPVSEEEFHLYLRVYCPTDDLVQNQGKLPLIYKSEDKAETV